jgi:hypothetical protein
MSLAEIIPARVRQVFSELRFRLYPQKPLIEPVPATREADFLAGSRPIAVDGSQMDDFQWEQDIKLQHIFQKINEGSGNPIQRDPTTKIVSELRISEGEKK